MTALFQFAVLLALGAIVAFLVKHWELFVGDKDIAFLIGFPALCLIAWLYDLRRGRLRKSSKVTTEHER
jgi:cyanate permease